MNAIGDPKFGSAGKLILTDKIRVKREHQRRIVETRMGSNLRHREPLTLQYLDKLNLGRVVILRNRVSTHIRRGPFTVELVSHVPFVGLVTAVIAQEDDVFEAVQFETPGGIFEDLFKRGFRHAYRSGETHVTRGRA